MAENKNVHSAGKTIEELFAKHVVYSMPFFQRCYAWEKDNLEEYWWDLTNLVKLGKNSGKTTFLGAVVLHGDTSQGENISASITEDTLEKFIVIDGQQRLTTFYLTLLALYFYAKGREKELQEQEERGDVDKEDLSGWCNYIANYHDDNYLFSHEGSNLRKAKVTPSLEDQPHLDFIINKGEKAPDIYTYDSKEPAKLFTAYIFLKKKIELFIESDGGDTTEQRKRYGEIFHALVKRTEVVQIITGPNLSPNEIFDRLNTSGVRLCTLDWARNEIFRRFPLVQAQRFFTTTWEPFEKKLKDVSEITDLKILRGKKKAKKEQERKEDQSERFFKAYGAVTDDGKFKVKKRTKYLKRHWDEDVCGYEQSPYKGSEIIIQNLEEHLPSYLALRAEKEPVGIDSELWKLIENMKELSLPPLTYPFLMPVIRSSMEGELPISNAIQAFKIVDSFFVRRALTKQDSGGLTPVFKNLWTECGKGKMNPELIWQSIKEKVDVESLEDDEDIKNNILEKRIDAKRKNRKKDRVKYVLMQYENELRQKSLATYPSLQAYPSLQGCGIDRIISKTESVVSEPLTHKEKQKDRDGLCGTLGNLTLLDPAIKAHRDMRNFKEMTVRELLRESTLLSVQELWKDFDTWDTNKIKQRGKKLGEWAVERWPLK